MTAALLGALLTTSACTTETATHTTKSPSVAGGTISASGKNASEIALERKVKSLSQQSRDIVVRNTVEGAVVGAVAGCALALMMGGNGDDCAKGAVAGGVVGAAGGHAVGRQAAEKNSELVKRDEVLARLKGINATLGSMQSDLHSVLKSQNAEIASLRRQVDADQISQSQYNSRLRAINSNRTAVSNGLQTAEQNVRKERLELASLERQDGRSLSTLTSAASSTEKRLASLRSTVSLIATK
ncbi:hypothetical protein LAZ29_12700 [Cereibacter sphaeroides]|uniref:hypothetical protein n=1 Tax=Cereibacter sphaeroides TaxID=1063 RepID=UPI001F1F6CE1|nr:hypothetical protein [Cereibacter sphaeroides]MCE6951788.1 hypothetical protein [Cereibacter sphaeroides]